MTYPRERIGLDKDKEKEAYDELLESIRERTIKQTPIKKKGIKKGTKLSPRIKPTTKKKAKIIKKPVMSNRQRKAFLIDPLKQKSLLLRQWAETSINPTLEKLITVKELNDQIDIKLVKDKIIEMEVELFKKKDNANPIIKIAIGTYLTHPFSLEFICWNILSNNCDKANVASFLKRLPDNKLFRKSRENINWERLHHDDIKTWFFKRKNNKTVIDLGTYLKKIKEKELLKDLYSSKKWN